MMNQDNNQDKSNETKKGDPAWDQHNKGNDKDRNRKHKNSGCGCGHK